MAVPAAAGYPQYSGSIISPKFSMQLLRQFYCQTIYGEISTTEYSGEITQCGDQITFFKSPLVSVRDYQKGGTIIHDTLDTTPTTMTIDQAKTFSIEVSQIDEKQICNFSQWKSEFMKNGAYSLATGIDTSILGTMYADADPNNSGTTAGVKSHAYNLGTTGNPVPVSSTNVIQVLNNVAAVLKEQCAPREGMFIVLPPLGETVLLNSDLRAAFLTGQSESPIINGRLPYQVAGFDVYISNFMTSVFDAAVGANVYQIVAGVKMATGFAAQIDRIRDIESPNTWNRYYQGLAVYGFKVLYPKAIASLYARFS